MQPLETSQQRRPAASAYASHSGWLKSSIVVIATFMLIFILHNLLFQDYREEIMNQLKRHQLSDEEIERFVPTPTAEKRRKETMGMAEMQKEIERLSTEMKQVQQVLNETLLSMGKKPLDAVELKASP